MNRKHSIASTASSTSISSNKKLSQNTIFMAKNKILADMTRAIQLVQKCFLENERNGHQQALTNSDYCVHELCQQFDNMFLFGLKKQEDGFWKLVVEFTHRNVLVDLKRLLNVRTCFGLGRAWIYNALNDNLMESYLKCFLENKKLVLRYYVKEQAMFMDEQIVSVLVTLVSGLENVEFKMYSDVPYLDHSCWPTHFNTKRYVFDTMLNASPGTISQLDQQLNTQEPNLNALTNRTSKIAITKNVRRLKSQRAAVLGTSANSQKLTVNNISFDDEMSTNNTALDGDSLSTCGSESGRFTNTNNTVSPNNSTNTNAGLTLKNSNEFLNEKNLQNVTQNDADGSDLDEDEKEENDKSVSSVQSNKNLDNRSLSINRAQSTHSIDYENEIDKLRQENNMNIANNKLIIKNKQQFLKSQPVEKKSPPLLKKTISEATISKERRNSSRTNPDQDLAESSLTISKSFDIKIKHLESSLKTIEDATLNMDAFVKDMTSVYQDYDEKLCNESQGEEDFLLDGRSQRNAQLEESKAELVTASVYDMVAQSAVDLIDDYKFDKDSEGPVSNASEMTTECTKTNDTIVSGIEDILSMQSMNEDIRLGENSNEASFKSMISSQSATNLNDSGYLAKFERNEADTVKQEIRVDNNTKLMIMIEIFEHGEDEQVVKFYHASRGHSKGEIETINLLISSYGIYILSKNEIDDVDGKASNPVVPTTATLPNSDEPKLYRKEAFIHQKQIDYIEVSLEAQAVHLVCINKRQSCWFTFACRNLTEHFIENLQLARKIDQSLKPTTLSVFREATQQKLSIKKFIASEENTTNNDVEIKSYSLIFYEDKDSSQDYLIQKEGVLWFLNKNSNTSSGSVWKKAYFVLKNDVLTKYRNSTDKKPLQIIKLNGEDFAGCRRNTNLSRANTIELILSNANAIYLSAKTSNEASDWLLCFCKIISLGSLHSGQTNISCLPCCSIITASRCYFCHEDLNTGFYRLLECIKFEEITRLSYDDENPYFCILYDDTENNKRYWFIYFLDELERDIFISRFKETWSLLFQVALTIEKCQSSETRRRCQRNIQMLHKEWTNLEN